LDSLSSFFKLIQRLTKIKEYEKTIEREIFLRQILSGRISRKCRCFSAQMGKANDFGRGSALLCPINEEYRVAPASPQVHDVAFEFIVALSKMFYGLGIAQRGAGLLRLAQCFLLPSTVVKANKKPKGE
jgi:hypothetical protein